MNVANSLTLVFTGGVQILPRLGFGASYVLSNAWTYAPSRAPICTVQPTCVEPEPLADATTYRVSTWALASIDYDVIDEMTLSLGYYNLTSQIGADGERRSPFYSPEARFFFTVAGNLDVIADRIADQPTSAPIAETRRTERH
jgi:hypothetical protein